LGLEFRRKALQWADIAGFREFQSSQQQQQQQQQQLSAPKLVVVFARQTGLDSNNFGPNGGHRSRHDSAAYRDASASTGAQGKLASEFEIGTDKLAARWARAP